MKILNNLILQKQLISNIATGTSPLSVASTTLNTNLNADLLDGHHGSYYLDYNNLINIPDIPTGGIISVERYFQTSTENQTTFTIPAGYSQGFIDVFLNGLRLFNEVDYTATNGTSVVLTSGVSAGEELEFVVYSLNFIQRRQIATSAANQSIFSIDGGYRIGLIDVYMNGLKIQNGVDYQAVDGQSVLFNTPLTVGQEIEFVINDSPDITSIASSFNGRIGDVVLTSQDVLDAGGATQGYVDNALANFSTSSEISQVISSNTATSITTLSASAYTSVEYTVQITQGSKRRVSKLLTLSNGSSVEYVEHSILEIGGAISGIDVASTTTGVNVLITDAATTNATVKIRYSEMI